MFLKLSGSVLFVENASFAINSSLLTALKDSCGVDIADLTAGWWWWWEGGGGKLALRSLGLLYFCTSSLEFFLQTRELLHNQRNDNYTW